MSPGIAAYCFTTAPAGFSLQIDVFREMFKSLSGDFRGLNDIAALMLLCLVAPKRPRGESRRHLLLEGAAGTAKTEMTKALARLLRRHVAQANDYAEYERVQGMPDLLPSSFLGYEARQKDGSFAFLQGGLLRKSHVFHVDEINRIPPRTLSVLLEAMAEEQVSLTSLLVKERCRLRKLPWLFVVGTQNPGTFVGTGALPEPLLDRFMARAVMPYPERKSLEDLLISLDESGGADNREENLNLDGVRIATADYVAKQGSKERGRDIAEFVTKILLASWPLAAAGTIQNLRRQLPASRGLRDLVDGALDYGLGVRAGQALRDLACATAWCRTGGAGPDANLDDVEAVAPYVLGHRLRFKPRVCVTPDEQSLFVRLLLQQVREWKPM